MCWKLEAIIFAGLNDNFCPAHFDHSGCMRNDTKNGRRRTYGQPYLLSPIISCKAPIHILVPGMLGGFTRITGALRIYIVVSQIGKSCRQRSKTDMKYTSKFKRQHSCIAFVRIHSTFNPLKTAQPRTRNDRSEANAADGRKKLSLHPVCTHIYTYILRYNREPRYYSTTVRTGVVLEYILQLCTIDTIIRDLILVACHIINVVGIVGDRTNTDRPRSNTGNSNQYAPLSVHLKISVDHVDDEYSQSVQQSVGTVVQGVRGRPKS